MLALSGALHLIALVSVLGSGLGLSGANLPETIVDVEFVAPPAPASEQRPPTPARSELKAEPPPPPPEPKTEPPLPPPEFKPPPPEHKTRHRRDVHSAPTPAPETPPAPPPAQENGLPPLVDHSLSAYKRELWARIERRKPRDIHIPGAVVITFTLGPDGSLLSARLDRSSGDSGLDHAAIDAVATAAPFPPPPPGLTPSQLTFSIPFQFR